MTRRQKRLDRIRQNPKNVRFEDLRRLLEDYGFELRRVKGSHHYFSATTAGKKHRIVIPYQRPHIKLIYVEEVLALLDLLEEAGNED